MTSMLNEKYEEAEGAGPSEASKIDEGGANPAKCPMFRTINGAAKMIREADPRSAVSPSLIRRAIAKGELKAKRVGKKYYVDVNRLIQYLSDCEEGTG
jgi:hypothetical protein